MDERVLLLLGLLRAQSQHGYQLNEFIEHNLSRVTDMKRPTAYAILDRLCDQGYVETYAEQAGNRPTRKVYRITETGEAQFQRGLREVLAESGRPTSFGDVGLMFLDALPPAEARACLERRLAQLDRQIALYAETPAHGHGVGVDLAIGRVLHLLQADRDWLREAVTHLSSVEETNDGAASGRADGAPAPDVVGE